MGKHKDKKHGALKDAHDAANNATLMSGDAMTPKDQRETAVKTRNKVTDNERPTRWMRFKEWTKKDKTFTDWCVAAFTAVLAVAAIYQFIVMGGQLDTMRKDQRPWMDLTFTTNSNALQVGYPITAAAHMVNGGRLRPGR